ncbi:MAG: hypothetical protein ACYDH2_03290 [Anaerolineaceae bacterium]|nr:MAG: hypothetical protein CVU45_02300 [Chloroflexi bacterium HGW-Chloroflexi-7]HCS40699.1 hypothetical protein [Anaerolineaceae bacterium]
MDEDIANQFGDELNAGESIEWCGKPNQEIFFEKEDIVTLLPNLVFSSLIVFILSKFFLNTISFLGIVVFILLTTLFTFNAITMLAGKLIIGPWRHRKTVYAVTNQRIIIISGIENRNIKSIRLTGLKEINVSYRKNGKGIIRFGNAIETPWDTRYTTHLYYLVERNVYIPEFEMIEDVRKVYNLIKKLQNE